VSSGRKKIQWNTPLHPNPSYCSSSSSSSHPHTPIVTASLQPQPPRCRPTQTPATPLSQHNNPSWQHTTNQSPTSPSNQQPSPLFITNTGKSTYQPASPQPPQQHQFDSTPPLPKTPHTYQFPKPQTKTFQSPPILTPTASYHQ